MTTNWLERNLRGLINVVDSETCLSLWYKLSAVIRLLNLVGLVNVVDSETCLSLWYKSSDVIRLLNLGGLVNVAVLKYV